MTPKNPAELFEELWYKSGMAWATSGWNAKHASGLYKDHKMELAFKWFIKGQDALEAAQPQGEDCSHAWPNMNASTSRKCMSCGVSEQDVINAKMEETGRKISEAFHTPPTDEQRAKAWKWLDSLMSSFQFGWEDTQNLEIIRAALQQPAGRSVLMAGSLCLLSQRDRKL